VQLDIDLVLGGPLEQWTAEHQLARPFFKARYPVLVEAPTFVVHGIVQVFPGYTPEDEIVRSRALFVPITEASVHWNGQLVCAAGTNVVLVNRPVIRTIRQLETHLLQ
jgi:hypothetical protein